MAVDHPLLPRLRQLLDLSEDEVAAVQRVPFRREAVAADQPILREGTRPTRCFALESGLACSSKVVATGLRQIVALHIPGDLPDLASVTLEVRDCDHWALSPCGIAYMEHRDLLALGEAQPRVEGALRRISLIDGAVLREWVINVGYRDAISRLAHLFCEIVTRMRSAGLTAGGRCALPATQDVLAEAMGISAVHVNRVLQELRRRGLVSFGQGVLTVHDWDGLAGIGDFRADYLHLGERGGGGHAIGREL